MPPSKQVPKDGLIRVNFAFTPSEMHEVRIAAAIADISVSEWVRQACRAAFANQQQPQKRQRVRLEVGND